MILPAVAIATLRLRSAGADTPALRLRAARQLQAAALEPPGLAPAAVLVVRRLSDPMPGRFGGGRPRPHPQWERAVRDELAAFARTAARPDGYGRLPPEATALLFADEAELVACLLADRARGEATARWWWRSVLPRLALPRSLAQDAGRDPAPVLCARPREAPAAVALLTRWGEAARVASALPTTGATRALAAVAREHALPPELVGYVAAPIGPLPPMHAPAERRHAARALEDMSPVPCPGPSPWAAWAPAGVDDAAVTAPVHCLFALAVALHVAPARVRSAAFVSRARVWWAAAKGHSVADAVRANDEPPSPAVTAPGTSIAAPAHARSREPKAERRHRELGAGIAPASPTRPGTTPPPQASHALATAAGARATEEGRNARARARAETAAPASATRAASEQPRARDAVLLPAQGRALPGGAARRSSRGPASRRQRDCPPTESSGQTMPGMTPAAAHAVLRGSGRATRLAGIFYLIHALQDLGLPDSFDPGWQANVAGPWGTVDLLARALLGSRLAEASGDPVWTALEELADWGARRSRAHGGPPASGVADPPFRVPASWRERLRDPLDRLRWASARGRLWLWSEAGYLVAHRRLRGDAAEVARREGALLAESDDKAELRLEQATSAEMPWTPPASTPARCPPRLCRWAAAVAPAVRRRLRLALGSSEDVTARLMVPGRVYVTSSHVDLVMRLDEADLAVRAAGLDRNPGWLPAYGRVVYFHFE